MEPFMQPFDDLPRISMGDPEYPFGSGFRSASTEHYIREAPLEATFPGHQAFHGLRTPSAASAMSRYLEAPDQNPLLRSLLYPRVRPQFQPDSLELQSAQTAEPPWPYPGDYDRQSSPDSSSWSCSSGKSFTHFSGEDHQALERNYCLSPRSNMFSWNDDQSGGFERGGSLSQSDGGFADKVSCISLSDLQHYPDAPQEQAISDTLQVEQGARAVPPWSASYPLEVDLAETGHSHDHKDSITTSEDETLLDADGEDIDENEQDDYNDDTYEPRRVRSSTMNARRRSATQQKPKPTTRGHKRSTSSASSDKKITKTPYTQTNRPRCKNSKGESAPGSPPNGTNDGSSTVRPFPCPLAGYSCTSAFGSKNEWKRHISSQHLRLGFWRCDLCADHTERHNDFNRKDLFTQHLRRMHGDLLQASLNRTRAGAANARDAAMDVEADTVKRCYRALRQAPMVSSCLFCTQRFEGAGSWEERVEHVGRHFETQRKAGKEPVPVEQWMEDAALEEWLVKEGMVVRNGMEWGIGDGSQN